MIFEHLTVGRLQANCYLLGDEHSGLAAVIDPGAEGAAICARIAQLGLTVSAILLTHAHHDHIGAAWTVKARLGGEIHLHDSELPVFLQTVFGLAAVFGPEKRPVSPAEIDRRFSGEMELAVGALRLRFLETPGHTPAHVSFYLEEQAMLFCGDTLFAGSIGRTDFPGSSRERLVTSVVSKIFPLPDDTQVFPGHGPRTSVGRERRSNPFFLRKGA